MMPLHRVLIACVSVCLVIMSAPVMATDEPSVDPCALVTKADVEQIIGKLKGDPTSNREERTRFYIYEFVNEKDTLKLWVFPASGLERARKSIKTLSPVTGLGQDAFITRNKDVPYIELYLKKGTVTLEVTMKESLGDEDKVKAIAKKAITRL